MLFRISDATAVPSYDTYRRRTGLGTWHGVKYNWASLEYRTHPGTHFASVMMCEATVVVMHSTAPFLVPHPTPTTFLGRLFTNGSGTLWENMSVDGNGEWIQEGIVSGSLCIAHDKSYMAEQSDSLCLAGIIMYCCTSRQWLKMSLAESSDTASNYRGELLGAVTTL
jgi:hypothetical protein